MYTIEHKFNNIHFIYNNIIIIITYKLLYRQLSFHC